MQLISRICVVFALVCAGSMAHAGAVPVELDVIEHNAAELTVVGPAGALTYTPAELEAISPQRLTTITPWDAAPKAFDGVLLTDLLAQSGLSDVPAIIVVAENGYEVRIPAEAWKKWPILLATRVNGLAHTRRMRGPIQFVMSMSEYPEAGEAAYENYWVWMAQRIQVAD